MRIERLFAGRGHRRPEGKRTRSASRRPIFETLERREVMTAAPEAVTVAGISYKLANVSANSGYNSGSDILQVQELTGSGWTGISGNNYSVSQIVGTASGLFMFASFKGGANQVWEYSGSGTSWTAVTGTNTSVSQVAGTASGLFMLANNGGSNQVWEYSGSGTSWTTVTGTNAAVDQIVGTGSGVFMLGDFVVNGAGRPAAVWEYAGTGTNWTQVSTNTVSPVEIAASGTAVYMLAGVGGYNQVSVYNGAGTSWTPITPSTVSAWQIVVSGTDSGLFMLAGFGGTPYVSEYAGSGTNWTTQLDEPGAVAGVSYSPAPAGVPLFNAGAPSYLDVDQGYSDDCWLLASLAEVAARDPQDIVNMFSYQGTAVDNGATVGVYAVKLYSQAIQSWFSIDVDTNLPAGGTYYDNVTSGMQTQSLWVALAEKAYAEADVLGLVQTNAEGLDDYVSLEYGDPSWALPAITGNAVNDHNIDPTNVGSAWNSGKLVVLSSDQDPANSHIVANHCYAVVGYNASSSSPFQVFNPWGTKPNGYAPGSGPNSSNQYWGLFNTTSTVLSNNFDEQSIGVGAANAPTVIDPTDWIAPSSFDLVDRQPSAEFDLGVSDPHRSRPAVHAGLIGTWNGDVSAEEA